MSLIDSAFSPASGHSLAAVGLESRYPELRRTPDGNVDFDWYLVRAGDLRQKAYAERIRAVWHRVRTAIATWHNGVRAWRERRRAVDELLNLDDRMLRDMGVNRAGVYFAVDHGREDIPAPANHNAPARPSRAA